MTTKFKIFAGSDGTSSETTVSETQNAQTTVEEAQTVKQEESVKTDETKKTDEQKHGMSEADHKLLKDIMKKKEELTSAKAEIAELKKTVEAIESLGGLEKLASMIHAEEDKQKKELEAKGEWDKLKKQMSEDHAKAMNEIQKKLNEVSAQYESSQKQIVELTIGAQFNNSQYIAKELVLTPSKTRIVYGEYFDLVDGQVVGYDKPRGQKGRTAYIDQYGNNLPFDAALAKIVEADPDAESMMKSKMKAGAGSSSKMSSAVPPQQGTTAQDKILKGLSLIK